MRKLREFVGTWRWTAAVLVAVLVLGMLTSAFAPMRQAGEAGPILPEPWGTILTFVVVPLIVQGLKIYREKAGKEFSRQALQAILFVVAIPFMWLGGGFLGLVLPGLPAFGAGTDLGLFLPQVFTWLTESLRVVGIAFGAVMGLYEVIGKAIMERASFATQAALRKRLSA